MGLHKHDYTLVEEELVQHLLVAEPDIPLHSYSLREDIEGGFHAPFRSVNLTSLCCAIASGGERAFFRADA